jgi:hypothetical protein
VNLQVEHNLAVVEYLRGKCKEPKVLVEALRSVKVGGSSGRNRIASPECVRMLSLVWASAVCWPAGGCIPTQLPGHSGDLL